MISPSNIAVKVYSITGALVADYYSNVECNSALDLELTILKVGGLDKFVIGLSNNITDPLFPDMICKFYIDGLHVYTGFAEVIPEADSIEDKVEIEGKGFIHKLKTINVNESYTTQTFDYILKDILSTYLGADVGVLYDVANISAPTITAFDIEFKDKKLFDVLEDLLEIANYDYLTTEYYYYVDKDQYFNFGALPTTIQKALFEGYHYQNPEVKEVSDKIINKILTYRTTLANDNLVEYVATYSDADSINENGEEVKKLTFADYASTAAISNLANAKIQKFKDPQVSLQINNLEVQSIPKVISSITPSNLITIDNDIYPIPRDASNKAIFDDSSGEQHIETGANVLLTDNTDTYRGTEYYITVDDTVVATGAADFFDSVSAGTYDGDRILMGGWLKIVRSGVSGVYPFYHNIAGKSCIVYVDASGSLCFGFSGNYFTHPTFTLDTNWHYVAGYANNTTGEYGLIVDGVYTKNTTDFTPSTWDLTGTVSTIKHYLYLDYYGVNTVNYIAQPFWCIDSESTYQVVIDKYNADEKWPEPAPPIPDFEPLYPFGKYRLANKKQEYFRTVSYMNDLDEWNTSGLVNTIDSISSTEVFTNRTSIKLVTASGSANELMELTLDQPIYFPTLLKGYIYLATAGLSFTIRIYDTFNNSIDIDMGENNEPINTWLKATIRIDLEIGKGRLAVDYDATNEGLLVITDLGYQDSNMLVDTLLHDGILNVSKVQIIVNNDVAGTAYFDRIEVLSRSYKEHELTLEEIKYNLGKSRLADASFGDVPDSVIDEVKDSVKQGDTALAVFSKQ